MMSTDALMARCAKNPILTSNAVPGSTAVRHGAVVKVGGGFKGLFRVDMGGLGCGLHLGGSDDGLRWSLDAEPVRMGEDDTGFPPLDHAYNPRVALVEGRHLVTWCKGDAKRPQAGLSVTEDFKAFSRMEDPFPSPSRTCAIFPRRVGGEYAMFHRPCGSGGTPYGDIFYATSPDLVHWGRHRFVFGGNGGWEYAKVGPGPCPIETREGWLLITHGVRSGPGGDRYYAGAALLDLDRPWKVIAWLRESLLAPIEDYERRGAVPNAVYPTSAVLEGDKLRLYYDCAGESVGAAEGRLSEIIRFVKIHGMP